MKPNDDVKNLVLELLKGNLDSIIPLMDKLQELIDEGELLRLDQLRWLIDRYLGLSNDIDDLGISDEQSFEQLEDIDDLGINDEQRYEQLKDIWRRFIEGVEIQFLLDLYGFNRLTKHIDDNLPLGTRHRIYREKGPKKFLKISHNPY